MGYHRAGFDVVGVDIAPQPHYPFRFHQWDVLELMPCLLRGDKVVGFRWFNLDGFAAIHASPPCQAYSKAQRIQKREHPDLIGPTREFLQDAQFGRLTQLPWVIENVPGAPLRQPIRLEGQQFGLKLFRPRIFETNWAVEIEPLIPPPPAQVKMGRKPKAGEAIQVVGNFSDVAAGRAAMGIDWMTRDELSEAIPPAYTQFIGEQLLARILSAVPL